MRVLVLVFFGMFAFGQDPTATLEGYVTDKSGGAIAGAVIESIHVETGRTQSQITGSNGSYTFTGLPVGNYELRVQAHNFSRFVQRSIHLEVNQTVRIRLVLEVVGTQESVIVEASAPLVETASNVLGRVVTQREIMDLPLDGRNFTQLGLLQSGVAPLTAGVSTAGGSLRSGHAYEVNGQRPESNNYLLDGVTNVNRTDGGFAIKIPLDAIAEFKILTHTAMPEYGGTSGATTSVVTRSGGNDYHGDFYEFLRNDKLDARNFFAARTEPLKQNQFGATLGGPIHKNRTFFFAYYEGFRNRQGITKAAVVPTPAQRMGDFGPAPLINYLTGEPFPDNRIPPALISPISLKVLSYYPPGNLSPSLFSSTPILTNDSDQGGVKLDHKISDKNQLSGRYSYATGFNINPLSIKGADVPGFPVGDDLTTQSVALSETHLFSATTINSLRAGFFRHRFLFDQRLNRTAPRELGFNYDTSLAVAQGPPFLIVSGYASVGDPITGPRNTAQNTFEIYHSISHVTGSHNIKLGEEFRRTQINAAQGIASNGFFVFVPFPASDSFANFLLGRPVVFFQVGGDLPRGLRTWDLAGFAQDEWRPIRRFTLNYGVRYEITTPFGEIRNRLNAFAPGRQSKIFPNAPAGLLFPGDQGVADRISPIYLSGWMPRVGFAWDVTGNGRMAVRSAYAIFYDTLANGVGGPLQAAISAVPWTQALQLGGPRLNYADPYAGQPAPFQGLNFPRPLTILTTAQNLRPPYAQDWNFSIQRAIRTNYLVEVLYLGTKGTRLPRFVEANPAVYGPGATAQNADQRRLYAGCEPQGHCVFGSVGLLTNSTSSTYHAAQLSVSRRYADGLGLLVSYTLSKSLDYISSLNLSGSAPRLVSGENDLAQNPFDLRAEHGPSLFDARHRLVGSTSYEVPFKASSAITKALLAGWQVNGIATLASGTPFTVYDSANVSLQGSAPEISGFYSSRPDAVSNPNNGPHTPDQWVSRSSFRRLDPLTEAGKFGNAGRNTARGPGYGNLDLSVLKTFQTTEITRLQFRAECFNVTNHTNFGLPVNDIASLNFGRILDSGSPRVFQFALKFLF